MFSPTDLKIAKTAELVMERRGWSVTKLGAEMAMSAWSLLDRINGRTAWKIQDLARLAELAGVTTDSLLKGEEVAS